MRSAAQEELAHEAWGLMSAFVRSHDPASELRGTLALGRGSGRVRALMSLAEEPLSLAALAQKLGVDPPYATIIVNELDALGLVTRSADPQDRRRKSVALTNAGAAAVATAQKIVDRPPPELLALSGTDVATIVRILRRLNG